MKVFNPPRSNERPGENCYIDPRIHHQRIKRRTRINRKLTKQVFANIGLKKAEETIWAPMRSRKSSSEDHAILVGLKGYSLDPPLSPPLTGAHPSARGNPGLKFKSGSKQQQDANV